MSRETYDPFKDETLGQPRPRQAPVRIDWKRVARMMAEGIRPPAVAAALGIAEDRIWRHLTRSASFRFRLCQEVERQRLLDQLDFGRANREAAIAASRQPGAVETLQWQSEQAGLAGSAADPAGVRLAVDGLGRSGRRRPGRASQAPLEETQQAKDRFVAAMRADLAAAQRGIERDLARRQRAPAPMPAPKPAPKPAPVPARTGESGAGPTRTAVTGPASTRMGTDEPAPTQTGTIGPDSTRTGADGPAPTRIGPVPPDQTVAGRWPAKPLDPPPPSWDLPNGQRPSRASLYRSIIDLPGPDWPPPADPQLDDPLPDEPPAAAS